LVSFTIGFLLKIMEVVGLDRLSGQAWLIKLLVSFVSIILINRNGKQIVG
jgi:hypothetical protein